MKIKLLIYGILFSFLFPGQIYAYLDPGTGSYLFQILIAGFLGSLFFAKNIIRKVRSFFGFLKKKIFKDNENK